jgi:Fe-Mn family superoxide dismutase
MTSATGISASSVPQQREPGVVQLYQLPELPYGYAALDPIIDERTMRLHHDKHHRAYVDGINAALEAAPEWRSRPIDDLLRHLTEVPEKIRESVRNQGGGHANHSLFWQCLTPRAQDGPSGDLAQRIKRAFGSTDAFREAFEQAGAKRFGSGWVVLAADGDANLEIVSLPNQDSALSQGKSPLLACDVWEHTYYLKYNNRRGDWLAAWWQVVNWEGASKRLEAVFR